MFSPSFRFALHWKYKVDNNTLVTQVANGIKITRLFNSEAVLNNLVPRAFPFWIGSATQFKREKPWERGCVLNRIWWKWLTFADGSSRLIKKIQREITAARTLLKRKEQEGWTGNEYLCLACFRVPRTNGSHFSRCLAASDIVLACRTGVCFAFCRRAGRRGLSTKLARSENHARRDYWPVNDRSHSGVSILSRFPGRFSFFLDV